MSEPIQFDPALRHMLQASLKLQQPAFEPSELTPFKLCLVHLLFWIKSNCNIEVSLRRRLAPRFAGDKKNTEEYNSGPVVKIGARKIAKIVAEEMGLQYIEFISIGRVGYSRDWLGNDTILLLSKYKSVKMDTPQSTVDKQLG